MAAAPLWRRLFKRSGVWSGGWSEAWSGACWHRNRRNFGQPAAQTHPHLLQQGEVTPGISSDEFSSRRGRFMEAVCSEKLRGKSTDNHIAVFPSAGKSYMSHDVPYPFRQNTDMLYLCGFQEADSVLVLHTVPGKARWDFRSVLFVPRRDPERELWDDPRSGVDRALTITGVDEAQNVTELGRYLEAYCESNATYAVWYDYIQPPHTDIHTSVMAEFLKQNKHCSLERTCQLVQHLRVIKSPAEVALMTRSCDIIAEAFTEVMRFSHPGVNESHLYAKVEFESRLRGGEFLAYPPVVAGGERANIIHYIHNNQVVESGELVLMDAGCELHGYASDLTRTWPVSGRYSAAQRVLYEAVLSVQTACIEQCSPDLSLDELFHFMLDRLGRELCRVGLIPASSNRDSRIRAARSFCPHHGHYLGMDVNDTASVSRVNKLQPGSVVTVEPGIYVPSSNTAVPKEFRGIGIRIEDDVLITSTGHRVLSDKCPKDPNEIEALVLMRDQCSDLLQFGCSLSTE